MRALIRIHLEPKKTFSEIWHKTNKINGDSTPVYVNNNFENYYDEVIRVFAEMGYIPQRTWKDNLCLFNWDEIPKNQSRLREFLLNKFDIDIGKNPEIEKTDEEINIKLGKTSVSLRLNSQKNVMRLKIDDVNTDKFPVKIENGKIEIYDDLEHDELTQRIFKDVPDDIKRHEMTHLIMTGYTSDGQAPFIVSSINPGELHVRLQTGIFIRLRKACQEFYEKALKFKPMNKITKIVIKPVIEVIEPNRDHPTIKGKIITNPSKDVAKENVGEVVIIGFSLLMAVILFLYSPSWALSFANHSSFNAEYIQGALERIYSAFLVTFFISAIGLLIKIYELKKYVPIKWNSFDAPSKE